MKERLERPPSIESIFDGSMKSFFLSLSLFPFTHRYASTLDRSIVRASVLPFSASSSWPEASAACAARRAVFRDMKFEKK